LTPLDPEETANYVNHRLRRAALGVPLEFPRDATDVIHARSRGVPRIVNVICDAALVFGYAEERRQIDLPLIREVLTELETTGILPRAASPEPVAAVASGSASSSVVVELAPRRVDAVAAAAAPVVPAAAALDVRPSVDTAVPRMNPDQTRRVALVEQREQALRQRERELAEQRRVLAEEYRLLRTQRAPAAAAPAADAMCVTVPPRPATARFDAARPEGFWSWLKRLMLGTSRPAVEEN
jgi:hypothetical protein